MNAIKSYFLWFLAGFFTALILIDSKNNLFVSADNELAVSVEGKLSKVSIAPGTANINVDKNSCVGAIEEPGSEKTIEDVVNDALVNKDILDESHLEHAKTKAALVKFAEYIGIESAPGLHTFQHEEITSVIEQQLMLNFYSNQGDIIEQFDGIEHYLDEYATSASPQFLAELLNVSSSQDQDTHSYALYTIGNAIKHFEGNEKRNSEIISHIAAAKSSESELVRLTVLQSLSEIISDNERLLREIRFFENDESDIIKAKLKLLRYKLE